MISQKENALRTIYWENPQYVPLSFKAIHLRGFIGNTLFSAPDASGLDVFGVPWATTKEGDTPKPGFCMFDDINDWEKYVKFPNVDDIDFRKTAEIEEQRFPYDPDEKLLAVMTPNGAFERLIALMGFENALCALSLEPEECARFFEAEMDFRVACTKKMIDAYKPDIFIYCDDVAMANGLFISPQTYRTLIKPNHRRLAEAVIEKDVIFQMHCCGKCEDIVEDFIDIGAKMWHSAQIMNDLSGILDKHKGKLVVDGGWDSSGPVSYINASEEMIVQEVRRCLTEYRKPGFIFCPVLLNENGNSLFVGDERLPAVEAEWEKMCTL